MEPYWQQVRIQQVIGRARRAGSHADLPPADRNVSVHLYVGTLHASQADVAPRNIRTRDWDGRLLTSDEHVLGVAADKARIIDAFATAVKEAAVDCPLWQPESTCFPRAD
jgi:hypothetical protein